MGDEQNPPSRTGHRVSGAVSSALDRVPAGRQPSCPPSFLPPLRATRSTPGGFPSPPASAPPPEPCSGLLGRSARRYRGHWQLCAIPGVRWRWGEETNFPPPSRFSWRVWQSNRREADQQDQKNQLNTAMCGNPTSVRARDPTGDVQRGAWRHIRPPGSGEGGRLCSLGWPQGHCRRTGRAVR